jgi:hypothetical protein
VIYIFDIDGTLADISHRLHFIQQKPADWRAFFAACPGDTPIPEVVYMIDALSMCDQKIIMITGRSDEISTQTKEWLAGHLIPCHGLYMRKEGDHRADNVVKAELLDLVIKDFPSVPIAGVFEDRKQVVDMYRARGLRVYQVAEGEF